MFNKLFIQPKPVIGCIHLLPLPGSPDYEGNFNSVIETAVKEAAIYQNEGVQGIIIENFRDSPFYPDQLPAETIAAMTAVSLCVKDVFSGPIGINALRNDAHSALAIAVATNAQFIRINVHTGAALTDQGIIQGKAHETLRLRSMLKSNVLIFADVAVKHAAPMAPRPIEMETSDNVERGKADAIIVSGSHTGGETNVEMLGKVKNSSRKPVLIGSGITVENLEVYFNLSDGFIIGSYFKKDGNVLNIVDENRVKLLMQKINTIKKI